MSKRSNSNRDGVVMVGEVEGKHVQVLEAAGGPPYFYEWRVINPDGSAYHPHNLYDTPDEAFAAAIEYLIPDGPDLEVSEPTKEDYDALNAALYVGGAQQDIEDLGTAVGTFIAMGQGIENLKVARMAMAYDLESIEDVLASAPGAQPEHIANLGKIAEILQAQTEVLELVLERSREVIAGFIQGFIRS